MRTTLNLRDDLLEQAMAITRITEKTALVPPLRSVTATDRCVHRTEPLTRIRCRRSAEGDVRRVVVLRGEVVNDAILTPMKFASYVSLAFFTSVAASQSGRIASRSFV